MSGFVLVGLVVNAPATMHGVAALQWLQPLIVLGATITGGMVRTIRHPARAYEP